MPNLSDSPSLLPYEVGAEAERRREKKGDSPDFVTRIAVELGPRKVAKSPPFSISIATEEGIIIE